MELELRKHLEESLNDHISNVTELNDGLQNRVFSFYYRKVKLVARLTLSRKRTIEQLHAELAFMETINLNGINTISPYKFHNQSITSFKYNGSIYWVVLFEFFNGKLIDVHNRSEWNANFFQNWGRTIANMHSTASETSKKFTRPCFIHDVGEFNPIPSLLDKIDPELAVIYESMKMELDHFSKTEDTFGLIHNDLHQGNFFVVKNELILFDFDDCAYNWYAQDLAVSLYHALWTGESFHPEWTEFHDVFITNFFDGYTSYRSVTKDEMKLVSIFLRMRELFLFLLFKSSWDFDSIEEWQKNKLIELEVSVKQGTVPYLKVLKNYEKYIS